MEKPLYRVIASLVLARKNCIDSGNKEWKVRHESRLGGIMRHLMPSGSGVDSGTSLVLNDSTEDKLVFSCEYHHMDEHGGYDGWTQHRITVRPSLVFEISLTISGKNRNDIKEYLHDVYFHALAQIVDDSTIDQYE